MSPPIRATRLRPGRLVAAPTAVTTRRQLNLHRETRRFYAFKAGDLSHAPAYADRIAAALRAAGTADFDVLVPVPLSPDRAASGAPHRTLALARALSAALGAPALELLLLAAPVTKHGDLPPDPTSGDISAWARRYGAALCTDPVSRRFRRILVVDDAVASGATLAGCIDALPEGTAYGAAAVHFAAPGPARACALSSVDPGRPSASGRAWTATRSRHHPPTTPENTR